MQKALLWYTNQLYEKHLGSILTPARVELVCRDLELLQEQMQRKESNSVWKVPVAVSLDVPRNHFEVVVSDEKNVLYLHEEEK